MNTPSKIKSHVMEALVNATSPPSSSHHATYSRAITALVCWAIALYAIHQARKYFQKRERARQFERFCSDQGASQTTKTIKYRFLPSMWNKVHLLSYRNHDLLTDIFGRRFRVHGPTHALYDGWGIPKVVHTIEPQNVRTVMTSRAIDYGVPDARKVAIGPIGSEGVVMTEGALWAQNRKIIQVGFRGARLTESVEDGLQMMFGNIAGTTDEDGWTKPFTLFHAFAQMSLDRSTKHMFGVSTGLQESEKDEDKSASERPLHVVWKESFETIASYIGVRSLLGTRAWVYDAIEFRRACALLRTLCDRVIDQAIGDKKKGIASNASFVGNLVQETSNTRYIRGVVLDLFIAGHNMTAGAMSWLFFELERHPHVYDQVRQEILETFGTESEPKSEMNWETLQTCPKLHNAIYEALRMYPTLPNIGRQAIKNTTLPTGGGENGEDPVAVAKGTVVMCCLFLMHRREEEWGDEPEEYRPDRWIGRTPGYEYAPFGGGPRICPGKLFGLVEMFYVTARIMQRFQGLRLPTGGVQVKRMGAGVLMPPGGATVQLQMAP